MALIDWQRVDDLAQEIGAEAVEEVVVMFLEETDTVIDRIRTQPPTTEDYHFLKGAALNLGLSDLAQLCQTGEAETKAGPADDVTRAQTIALFAASRQALLAGLAGRFSA
ncbi:MAG: Hpt domain-containing protein [Rhodobacteraceae bacterium]|jgi:histidine phosphotransfer protein HptB|nr:Hpt domain-containing protein [Paracoccaceae bacterium]